MSRVVRVALCQDNLPVGDLAGNVRHLQARVDVAREHGADLVVFPELSITGYPPEDLLLKPGFVKEASSALRELAAGVTDITALVGYPEVDGDGTTLHNSAAVLCDGRVAATYRKHYLPNYAVFDERRYFAAGNEATVVDLDGCRIGLTVCEDIWVAGGPAEWAAVDGQAELVVNLSASPYHMGKGEEREQLFSARCSDYRCFLAFCNAVGGQDELVFDGHSLVIGPDGTVVARGKQFEQDLVVVDLDLDAASAHRATDARWNDQTETTASGRVTVVHAAQPSVPRTKAKPTPKPPAPEPSLPALLSPDTEVYHALTLGTADYVRKNGFRGTVLGLSGGIDSALALTIAADALGPESVTAVSMPSRFTAHMNRDDARQLANNLGVTLLELPIEDLAASYDATLAGPFSGTEPDVAEENLQARIRGNLLMALSNKFGWLVLTTGNKSEMSVGYTTLYGDMAGGFAILKDVFKTRVFRLARWRNRDGEVIPQRIIDKPPMAELRDHQLDTDSLPPYDDLDGILEAYVEHDESPAEIEARGFDAETVWRVLALVDGAEYKRRQAPPGVRISTRAFGKDRRLPITNRYRPR